VYEVLRRLLAMPKNRDFDSAIEMPHVMAKFPSEHHAMTELRPPPERGQANHGWLDSYHSFSFADYQDRGTWGSGRYASSTRIGSPRASGLRHPRAPRHGDHHYVSRVRLPTRLMGTGSTIVPGAFSA